VPWHGHDALYCKVCERHRDEVGPLSARYKCADCARRRQRENIDQIRVQQGPYFEAWRRGMYASTVEWFVKTGYVTDEQKQLLLDKFNEESLIIAQYEASRGGANDLHFKSVGKRLPKVATARQRHVAAELREHYRKAEGDPAQQLFLVVMNVVMQLGFSRLVAEKPLVEGLGTRYPGFSPLRAELTAVALRSTDAAAGAGGSTSSPR
jgi:hypothetical protein